MRTWKALENGIPASNPGKIGLAISYHNPDHIYAAIELDRKTGGIFMSRERGESWTKQSDAVSGATGPHYYQELYTTPHAEGTLYLMDVQVQVSIDHGVTFSRMSETAKHSDNHAIAFKMSDPNYILMGTDGGLFETYDGTKTWRFVTNLPVSSTTRSLSTMRSPFTTCLAGRKTAGPMVDPHARSGRWASATRTGSRCWVRTGTSQLQSRATPTLCMRRHSRATYTG